MNDLKDIVAVECDECGGAGFVFYGSSEDYDVMKCECISDDVDFIDGIMGA
jgi:hypothetical protein